MNGFLVGSGHPVPTLAQLQSYRAVLVYSDANFSNNVAMGNVLADYVDSGGGVVLNTFSYSTGSFGIAGRLVTGGYLPFTLDSYNLGSSLTLVADEPIHPILNGVSSFDGGTSSYHNSSISNTAGSGVVAHWSNGQPLVGTNLFDWQVLYTLPMNNGIAIGVDPTASPAARFYRARLLP